MKAPKGRGKGVIKNTGCRDENNLCNILTLERKKIRTEQKKTKK